MTNGSKTWLSTSNMIFLTKRFVLQNRRVRHENKLISLCFNAPPSLVSVIITIINTNRYAVQTWRIWRWVRTSWSGQRILRTDRCISCSAPWRRTVWRRPRTKYGSTRPTGIWSPGGCSGLPRKSPTWAPLRSGRPYPNICGSSTSVTCKYAFDLAYVRRVTWKIADFFKIHKSKKKYFQI